MRRYLLILMSTSLLVGLMLTSCGILFPKSGGKKEERHIVHPQAESEEPSDSDWSPDSDYDPDYESDYDSEIPSWEIVDLPLSTDPKRKNFSYDLSSNSCPGYNRNYIGECGLINDKDLCDQTLSPKLDLRGSSLRNVDFCGKDLSGAVFTGASISSSDFTDVNLTDANFDSAQITSSTFQNTNLTGAYFVGSYLRSNVFRDNNYSRVLFSSDEVKSRRGFTSANFMSDNTVNGGTFDAMSMFPESIQKLTSHYSPLTYAFEALRTGNLSFNRMQTGALMNLDIKISNLGASMLSKIEEAYLTDTIRHIDYFSDKLSLDPDHHFSKIFNSSSFSSLIEVIDQGISHLYVDDAREQVVAHNMAPSGIAAYINALNEKTSVRFKLASFYFNSLDTKIDSLEVRPVAVGRDIFFSPRKANLVSRIGTIVHESWHSRCNITPTLDEAESIATKGKSDLDDRLLSCFNFHVRCTHSSEVRKLGFAEACDRHKYGAYAIGWILADYIAESCKNCTEVERQLAKAEAISNLARLEKAQEMLNDSSPSYDLRMLTLP